MQKNFTEIYFYEIPVKSVKLCKTWQSHCYISKKQKQLYVKSNQL